MVIILYLIHWYVPLFRMWLFKNFYYSNCLLNNLHFLGYNPKLCMKKIVFLGLFTYQMTLGWHIGYYIVKNKHVFMCSHQFNYGKNKLFVYFWTYQSRISTYSTVCKYCLCLSTYIMGKPLLNEYFVYYLINSVIYPRRLPCMRPLRKIGKYAVPRKLNKLKTQFRCLDHYFPV